MAFYAGKKGSVKVQKLEDADGEAATGSSVARPLSQWSFQGKAEAIDVTNFTSEGYQESVTGILGGTIRASGPYAKPEDGADIAIGDKATFTLAFGGTGPTLSVPARITAVNPSIDVKGVGQIEIEAETTGSFSFTA